MLLTPDWLPDSGASSARDDDAERAWQLTQERPARRRARPATLMSAARAARRGGVIPARPGEGRDLLPRAVVVTDRQLTSLRPGASASSGWVGMRTPLQNCRQPDCSGPACSACRCRRAIPWMRRSPSDASSAACRPWSACRRPVPIYRAGPSMRAIGLEVDRHQVAVAFGRPFSDHERRIGRAALGGRSGRGSARRRREQSQRARPRSRLRSLPQRYRPNHRRR